MKRVQFIAPLLIFTVFCASASALDVSYNVNANGNKTSISPYVYGSNWGGGTDYTIRRSGGNRLTGYNWENNFSNAGSDWYHSSDRFMSSSTIPGKAITDFHDTALSQGQASIVTLQMAGYVSADDSGTVTVAQRAPSSRWRKVVFAKGAPFCSPPGSPVTNDANVYMDEFVNFLVSEYGYAGSPTGVKFYNLDNEPALWGRGNDTDGTHPRIHPDKTLAAEVKDKGVALSIAVKNVDPNAQILGPVAYGFMEYLSMQDANDWPGLKAIGNYGWYLDYYLDKMEEASSAAGKRLLDVLDVHWYPEAYGDGQRICFGSPPYTRLNCEARMQAPRTLWDYDYHENSWIESCCGSWLPILPPLFNSINTYYPGTKLAITEYDYGAQDHWSGGIATSDVLGIFGKYGVYIATYWGDNNYVDAAIKMYRNYDGSDSTFGDMNVPATTNNKVDSSIYASVFDGNDYEIHLVVINKNQDNAINGTFTITSDKNFNAGRVWAFDGNDGTPLTEIVDITERTPISSITNNTFTYTFPKLSVSHVVLTAPPCPQYELNGDCHVDYSDLAALIGSGEYPLWLYQLVPDECGGDPLCPDINGDLIINFNDFALLAQGWGM